MGMAFLTHREIAPLGRDAVVTIARRTVLDGCARPGMVALFGKPATDEELETAMSDEFQARLAAGLAKAVRTFLELPQKPSEGAKDGNEKKGGGREKKEAGSGDSASVPGGADPRAGNPVERAALDANTERRWKLVRKEGGLADLPEGAREVESELVGAWPRQAQVRFVAPKQEVLSWLEFSPGRVGYDGTLSHISNYSLLIEALGGDRVQIKTSGEVMIIKNVKNAAEVFSEHEGHPISFMIYDPPSKPGENWRRIRENARADRRGHLGSLQCGDGISVQLSAKNEAEIGVTLTRDRSRSIYIAE